MSSTWNDHVGFQRSYASSEFLPTPRVSHEPADHIWPAPTGQRPRSQTDARVSQKRMGRGCILSRALPYLSLSPPFCRLSEFPSLLSLRRPATCGLAQETQRVNPDLTQVVVQMPIP